MLTAADRMNQRYLSSLKTSQTACCSRHASQGRTDTRSSKAGVYSLVVFYKDITDTAVETLIVWTEQNGTDMALSFQEAEGCGVIWY